MNFRRRAVLVGALVLSACGTGGQRASEALRAQNAALTLVFVRRDCPVSEAFAPEIRLLCDAFTPRGVDFTIVYLDPRLERDEAVAHARARYGPDCDVVVDSNRYLARLASVSVTPEVAVVAPDGQILYRGRIDDTWESVGIASVDPTTSDLHDALDAVLGGRPVASPFTTPIGTLVASEIDDGER